MNGPVVMANFETARIDAYFAHLASRLGPTANASVVCIAHMVPNTVNFLPALSRVAPVRLVLPKPKSVSRPEYAIIKTLGFATANLRRDWSSDGYEVVATLLSHGITKGPLLLVDIGGYFASSADDIVDLYDGPVLGIMEGTENGVQEYERVGLPRGAPLVTVARSPLKLPEDYLVGSSVVFSVEAILREQAQILQTRTACVIGYGRVGRGVASVLRGRGISTVVHDVNPIAVAEAAARGFQVFRRLDSALSISNLVICATGNTALNSYGFAALRSGSVVATVTSSDSELDMAALSRGYRAIDVSEHITRYEEGSRYFWLLNGGNAANFVHGAVIGPAIQLIEGEKLAAVHALARGEFADADRSRPNEVCAEDRRLVAEVWNEHFLAD